MADVNLIIHWLLVAVFPACVLMAVVEDFRFMTISNSLSLTLVIGFIPVSLMAGLPFDDIFDHYLIGFIFLIVGAVTFMFGLIGGGDVKLMAAIAVWLNPADFGAFLIVTALLGGGLAIVVIVMRRFSSISSKSAKFPWLNADEGLPYGLAIGAAALFLLPGLSVLPSY